MNNVPDSQLQSNSTKKLPDLSWIGCLIGIILCSLTFYMEIQLQQSILALPIGAFIRPMGEGLLGVVGLLFGVPVSLFGIAIARVEHKRRSVWVGIVGVILCLLPIPIAQNMFTQTMSTSGVHLAP